MSSLDDLIEWDFMRAVMAGRAKLAEPALHIPQHRQPKICPRCGGCLSTESGFDICDCCGYDGGDTGKLRAGA